MPAQFIESVIGSNVAGLAVPSWKMVKSGGAQLVDDAGAASNESINGDGFLEHTAVEDITFRAVGLSDTDSNKSLGDIVFAWYLKQDGTLEVRENGVVVASPGSYAGGDVFRVERIGSAIRYYKNGELQYTSASTSSGPLRVDTTLLNIVGTASSVDLIRLYDATSGWVPLTWQNVANVTITARTHTARRLTFTAPTKMRPGDRLIAVIAAQATDYPRTSDEWTHEALAVSPTNRRGWRIYTRTVTDDEPLSYAFDLAVTQNALGVLLVYRELADAAPYGAAALDHVATLYGFAPTVVRQQLSDLVLGVVYQNNPLGGIVVGVSGATVRSTHERTTVFTSARMTIIDSALHPPYTSERTGVIVSGLPSGASAGVAAFGLPGRQLIGDRHVLSSEAIGAIGLPTKGI